MSKNGRWSVVGGWRGRFGPGPVARPRGTALLVLPAAVVIALGSGVGPSRAGQEPAAAKARKAVVPFTMLPTNHMLVEAKINGKGPYRLIFDLGAPITLLSNRASEAT